MVILKRWYLLRWPSILLTLPTVSDDNQLWVILGASWLFRNVAKLRHVFLLDCLRAHFLQRGNLLIGVRSNVMLQYRWIWLVVPWVCLLKLMVELFWMVWQRQIVLLLQKLIRYHGLLLLLLIELSSILGEDEEVRGSPRRDEVVELRVLKVTHHFDLRIDRWILNWFFVALKLIRLLRVFLIDQIWAVLTLDGIVIRFIHVLVTKKDVVRWLWPVSIIFSQHVLILLMVALRFPLGDILSRRIGWRFQDLLLLLSTQKIIRVSVRLQVVTVWSGIRFWNSWLLLSYRNGFEVLILHQHEVFVFWVTIIKALNVQLIYIFLVLRTLALFLDLFIFLIVKESLKTHRT